MSEPSACQYCNRPADRLSEYIDRSSRRWMVCCWCLSLQAERRSMEVKVHLMGERLKAQDCQYKALEHELERHQDIIDALLDRLAAARLSQRRDVP